MYIYIHIDIHIYIYIYKYIYIYIYILCISIYGIQFEYSIPQKVGPSGIQAHNLVLTMHIV